jgi:hypothetical protein
VNVTDRRAVVVVPRLERDDPIGAGGDMEPVVVRTMGVEP